MRSQIEEQRQNLNQLLTDDTIAPTDLATAFGELGQLYLLYDLSTAAEAALSNAASLAPTETRWVYLLGSLYRLDNELDAASAAYERVIALGSTDPAVLIHLGNVHLRREAPTDAEPLFRQAIEIPGFEAAAQYGLGRVHALRGEWTEAAAAFAKALELQPAANSIHFQLGVAFRELGDQDRARFHLENRGETEVQFPDRVAYEVQQLASGVGAMLLLGRVSLAVGDLDAAEERIRRAVEIDPESPEALKSLAGIEQRRGRLNDAIELYERAIAASPGDAGLRFYVAQVMSEARALAYDEETARESKRAWDERAVIYAQQSLQIAPDFVQAWVLLSDLQKRLGNYDEADQALLRALDLRPSGSDLRFLRARLLAAADRDTEGLVELNRFLEEVSKVEAKLAPEALVDIGALFATLGDPAAGIPLFEQVLADESDAVTDAHRASAHFQLGNLAVERGDTDAAVEHYQQTLALSPELAVAHFNLGTIYGRQERFAESAAAHRKATELDPLNHRARFSEAMALVLAEDYATAKARLEEALEKFPSAPGYAHLLTRLLVAAPVDEVRDSDVGLDLAFRLFQAIPSPEHGETVAMALAEAGRFDRAIEWQQRVVDELQKSSEASSDKTALAIAQRRLETYHALEVVRSPWLDG